MEKNKSKARSPLFNERVDIDIHSYRRRLADPDGISAKGLLDGIVLRGILKDDSQKEIRNITYRQTKSKEDRTVITLTSIDTDH